MSSLSFLLAALLFAAPTSASAAAKTLQIDAAAAKSNNAFAWALYDEAKPDENLFFSPLSIQSAFGMAYAGARGSTANELEKSLKMAATGEDYHRAMGGLIQGLNDGKRPFKLRVVNQIWGQKGLSYTPEFADITSRLYGAEAAFVDFAGAPDPSRKTINAWVEKQTNDLIKDLLPPGSINGGTVSVLTNAIYFKGDWESQFKKSATRDLPFNLAGGGHKDVPMMHQEENSFLYAQVKGAQVLSMPYKGDELSMVVVLPEAGKPIDQLEVSNRAWDGWVSALNETEVEVWFPRFEMSWGGSIKSELQALGIQRSFQEGAADFSGIYGSDNLFISDVFHKAFVSVDEVGTEAAAATAIVVSVDSMMYTPVFKADRPFLFAIRHDVSGALLFVGRVMDPSK